MTNGVVFDLKKIQSIGKRYETGATLEFGDWLREPTAETGLGKASVTTLEEMEREHILKTLEIAGWRGQRRKRCGVFAGVESDHAGGADEEARHRAQA